MVRFFFQTRYKWVLRTLVIIIDTNSTGQQTDVKIYRIIAILAEQVDCTSSDNHTQLNEDVRWLYVTACSIRNSNSAHKLNLINNPCYAKTIDKFKINYNTQLIFCFARSIVDIFSNIRTTYRHMPNRSILLNLDLCTYKT